MRITAALLAMLTLAACAPAIPDSAAGVDSGVGFQDYNSYRNTREVELAGPPTVVGGRADATVATTVAGTPAAGTPASTGAAGGGTATIVAANPQPTTPAANSQPVATATARNNQGLSDEQDFGAVSSRQSIQSDAERLRAQREAYQVVQPTAVPTRAGSSGPNIVAFAASTGNALGEKVHRRSAFVTQSRYDRNCARFASDDLAQEAFLDAGGPERDRLGLDPDGDGFACSWDPRPYRRAAAIARQ